MVIHSLCWDTYVMRRAFLLHINDLPSCVNSKVRLFADDCLLYREIKNNQDQIVMQRDLDALMDW